MSLGSGSGRVVPPLTVRMARASNPRGTAAMWVRDRLDELFMDEDFTDWFPADGRRRKLSRSPPRHSGQGLDQVCPSSGGMLTGRPATRNAR